MAHAGGHLTDALEGLMMEDDPKLDDVLEDFEHDGKQRTVRWLLGQLWNCTDALPSGDTAYDYVQGKGGRTMTWGVVARLLMDELKKGGTK